MRLVILDFLYPLTQNCYENHVSLFWCAQVRPLPNPAPQKVASMVARLGIMPNGGNGKNGKPNGKRPPAGRGQKWPDMEKNENSLKNPFLRHIFSHVQRGTVFHLVFHFRILAVFHSIHRVHAEGRTLRKGVFLPSKHLL